MQTINYRSFLFLLHTQKKPHTHNVSHNTNRTTFNPMLRPRSHSFHHYRDPTGRAMTKLGRTEGTPQFSQLACRAPRTRRAWALKLLIINLKINDVPSRVCLPSVYDQMFESQIGKSVVCCVPYFLARGKEIQVLVYFL